MYFKWRLLLLAGTLMLGFSMVPAKDLSSSPPILWGFATNDFRVGLVPQKDFKKGDTVSSQTVFYIGTNNSSKVARFYCPSRNELFMARLFDAQGVEVQKTALGKEFGREPAPVARMSDRPRRGPERWRLSMATPKHEDQIAYFNILDHFVVKRSGEYELRVELRLYQIRTNGLLVLLKVPINTPVQVQALKNMPP